MTPLPLMPLRIPLLRLPLPGLSVLRLALLRLPLLRSAPLLLPLLTRTAPPLPVRWPPVAASRVPTRS
jgi:hypothetical protein